MPVVLVTGSSGLVGRALQRVVAEQPEHSHQYIFLTSQDGDLTQEEHVATIFRKYKPQVLIHLAANVGGLFKNMHKKAEMLEDNNLMNTFLLRCARQYKLQKVIMVLSTCIFPDGMVPLTEEKLHLGPPHPSNEGYAYAKRVMEVHARILATEHGVQTVCLTPTNIYGEYDNFNLENAHVFPALVRKCYEAKENNYPFMVCGTGKPLRQFIYSYDLARMIWQTLHDQTLPAYSHFICSPPSHQEISIADLAKQIAKEMGYEHALIFNPAHADGQYKKTVEPHPYFKDFSFTPLSQGIKNTVKWFVQAMPKGEVRI